VPAAQPTTENGRTIAGMYEAFARGDVPHVLAQIHPEVEWIETETEGLRVRGTYRSPQAVLENVFMKVPEDFETFELRPERWIETGDDVVVTGRVAARTRSGQDLGAPYCHVFSFRDGKVARNDNYHDTGVWLNVLGRVAAG
jgi:ketosteroid isomerase-like protein